MKHESIVSQMTLAEKCRILSGFSFQFHQNIFYSHVSHFIPFSRLTRS